MLANALKTAHGSTTPLHPGSLPFTGINLTLIALVGLTLIIVGAYLWKKNSS